MLRILLPILLVLGLGAQAQTFAGLHYGIVGSGLHLGYNDPNWGVRIGGLPGESGGAYEAHAYGRLSDPSRSAWHFGVGALYLADREFFYLFAKALVGYEWRLAPGFGLYLEYAPGFLVAQRSPPPTGMNLLPLAALIRLDLGMSLYF